MIPKFDVIVLSLGVFGAVIYAILGYLASGDKWDSRKFLRTVILALLVAWGMDSAGYTTNVYTAVFPPTMITILIQKIIDYVRT